MMMSESGKSAGFQMDGKPEEKVDAIGNETQHAYEEAVKSPLEGKHTGDSRSHPHHRHLLDLHRRWGAMSSFLEMDNFGDDPKKPPSNWKRFAGVNSKAAAKRQFEEMDAFSRMRSIIGALRDVGRGLAQDQRQDYLTQVDEMERLLNDIPDVDQFAGARVLTVEVQQRLTQVFDSRGIEVENEFDTWGDFFSTLANEMRAMTHSFSVPNYDIVNAVARDPRSRANRQPASPLTDEILQDTNYNDAAMDILRSLGTDGIEEMQNTDLMDAIEVADDDIDPIGENWMVNARDQTMRGRVHRVAANDGSVGYSNFLLLDSLSPSTVAYLQQICDVIIPNQLRLTPNHEQLQWAHDLLNRINNIVRHMNSHPERMLHREQVRVVSSEDAQRLAAILKEHYDNFKNDQKKK